MALVIGLPNKNSSSKATVRNPSDPPAYCPCLGQMAESAKEGLSSKSLNRELIRGRLRRI